jgi:hypothetical protein
MTTRVATAAALAAGLLAGGPALAHHSVAMYDRAHPVTIEGVVKTFEWVNPHSKLELVTTPKDGTAPKTWTVEMSSPGIMTRAGWTKRTFTPGDHITLELSPSRAGGQSGLFGKAMLNGKVVRYDFTASEKAGLE